MKRTVIGILAWMFSLASFGQVQFGGLINAKDNSGTIGQLQRNLGQLKVWDSASLAKLNAGISITNFPSSQAVTGTFWQTTQPVSGTFWQATQPISGTIAATQSGTWNIGAISTLPSIPAGANTIGNVGINGTVPVSGTFYQATQPVSGTFWQTTQPISGTVTANAGSGTQNVSVQNASIPVTGAFYQATQPISSATNIPTVQNDLTGTASIAANATTGASITLNGTSVYTIQLSGTFVGTVQIQLSVDGTNFVNVTGSNQIFNRSSGAYMASGNLTAAGIYDIKVTGIQIARIITTAYTSGTIVGAARGSTGDGIVGLEGVPAVTVSSGTITTVTTVSTVTTLAQFLASAAAAEATANPTTTGVRNFPHLFNGSTWDRQHGNWNTTTTDAGAKTVTFNGATQTNYDSRGAKITALIGAVTGTTPTLVMQMQWSPDAGTTWLNYGSASTSFTPVATNTVAFDIYPTNTSVAGATPGALTNGATQSVQLNAVLPRTWRMVYTIGGTTPSITLTGVYVNYNL